MKKIPLSFYSRKNVVQIAHELLGKIVVTNFESVITSGRIVETEAYIAITDKASHSFGGRRTARNEHMYSPPGTAYIYVCYGMHQMLNVVTNNEGIPDAVLIRAVEPIDGIETMARRIGKNFLDISITRGPGNLGKALGINKQHSGFSLLANEIYLMDDGFPVAKNEIGISRRTGVQSAGDDGLLPYRFYIRGNKYVSGSNR